MALIQSSSTVSLTAYFTSLGRALFLSYDKNGNQTRFEYDQDDNLIDKLEVVGFTLYDADTNYKSNEILLSGDITALAGTKNQQIGNTLNNIILNKNQIIK